MPKKIKMIILCILPFCMTTLVIALTYLYYRKKSKACLGEEERSILRKKCRIMGVILISYLVFPLIINVVITGRLYLGWHLVESSLLPEEWFAFLASYVGNIGTILFGWIAYWQTEVINRQSKQAKEQQDQIDELKRIAVQYQICPAVQFCGCFFAMYHDSARIQVHRRKVRKAFIAQYGAEEWNREIHRNGTDFVVLAFDLRYQGMIPVTECRIEKLVWKIAGEKHEINLSAYKTRLSAKNTLMVVIEEADIDSEKREQFFESVALLCEYRSHKLYKYQESELIVQILFSNEVSKRRRYSVTYWLDAMDSASYCTDGMVSVVEPYVRMEETDEEGDKRRNN